jgi:hypothetical protein
VKGRRELSLVAGPAHIDDEALAIAIATSRPWSSSTSASAMSMPVVTPADVQNFPSCHEDRFRIDADAGIEALQLCRGRPMCCYAAAFEQARASQQECAGADRAGASGRAMLSRRIQAISFAVPQGVADGCFLTAGQTSVSTDAGVTDFRLSACNAKPAEVEMMPGVLAMNLTR